MSEQRLIDANFLALSFRTAAKSLVSANGDNLISDTYVAIAEYLESGRIGITVDAVPREEYESLLKRFQHLLESDYISSFDEVKLGTGEYKRDIREADLEHPRGRWGFRAYRGDMRLTVNGEVVCSNCHAPYFRVVGTWFKYCPHCGAKMDGGVKR